VRAVEEAEKEPMGKQRRKLSIFPFHFASQQLIRNVFVMFSREEKHIKFILPIKTYFKLSKLSADSSDSTCTNAIRERDVLAGGSKCFGMFDHSSNECG
jgi:hypothetical protein